MTKPSRVKVGDKPQDEVALPKPALADLRWVVNLETTQGTFNVHVSAPSRGAALNAAIAKVYAWEHPKIYHILDSSPAVRVD